MYEFFNREQLQTPSYKSEKGVLSCASCGLYRFALTPKMEPYGGFKKGIMVIGEAPGEDEDRRGRPWQGKMGRVLQRKYKQLGLDLFEDCVSLNAVNCHPVDKKGSNRTPTEQEVACCRQKVLNAIKQYQPRVIILQGGTAVSSLIGYRWKEGTMGVMTWRGWTIPDREYNAWVCPTFHPSFIERQEEQNEAQAIWTRDLKKAFEMVETPLPNYPSEEECVEISYDIEGVLKEVNRDNTMLAFDIETTGLKPYNTDVHQIVTISFCNQENKAYAIPFPEEKKHLRLLKELLENPKTGKIAANMKYEDNWLVSLHDVHTHPWAWDTMQAAHILDNRLGITSLEFQSFVRFGLPPYSGEVKPYLKSKEANTPNRIMELTKDKQSFRKLLFYNGIDSLMTYRLAMSQMKEMSVI